MSWRTLVNLLIGLLIGNAIANVFIINDLRDKLSSTPVLYNLIAPEVCEHNGFVVEGWKQNGLLYVQCSDGTVHLSGKAIP
jgi:hypothetical protein